jgi:catechol 2,3-dioxygenase-like lactoylglutathione lyase family enzyme
MKRLHVHLSVTELEQSVHFYTALFAAGPTVRKLDYAKWLLEDPRVNFAISTRGRRKGLDHFGIQVGNNVELVDINARIARTRAPSTEQKSARCCYTQSDKYWTVDPQGIPWEAFHTLGSIPVFGTADAHSGEASRPKDCCTPTSSRCC